VTEPRLALADPEETPTRALGGLWGRVTSVTAVVLAAFVLYTSAFGPWPNLMNRAIFVGLAFILTFTLYPWRRGAGAGVGLLDVAMIVLGVAGCAYIVVQYEWIMENPAESTTVSFWLGLAVVVLVLEGMRRTIDWPFVVVAAVMIVYAYFGNWIPGRWGHRGFDLPTIVETLFLTDRGVWGVVTGIVATVVAMYVVFGAVIFFTGGGDTFVSLSLWLAGRSTGGAGKVATVASGLFGMVSGSAAANAATVGAFTIPMMRRLGYRREFAAAVEAAASTGGQIMPPVMGAGAFVMAEMLQVSYLSIAAAAAIPALLYYLGVGATIHFEARRGGLPALPADMIPKIGDVLAWRRSLPLFVPLVALVWILLAGRTPQAAAFWATALGLLIYLAAGGVRPDELRRRGRAALRAVEAGGRGLVMIAFLGAGAQIIIGMITLTGVGIKLSELLISASGGSLVTALLITALICTILGMGVTTTADYILAASVIGPALVKLGLTPFTANLFIFYWASSSALTPPVAAAVFVTAGLAGSPVMRTGIIACRLAIAAFLAPFMFVYAPALLLQGSLTAIVVTALASALGVVALAAGIGGWLVGPAPPLDRALLLLAGALLVVPGYTTDAVGLGLLLAVGARQRLAAARVAAPAA
jgi:TRAP transporter 4TM/12TM fusion protein